MLPVTVSLDAQAVVVKGDTMMIKDAHRSIPALLCKVGDRGAGQRQYKAGPAEVEGWKVERRAQVLDLSWQQEG